MENGNRKARKRETRINKIIDAAEKVFFAKGYENTTLDDIAKEADFVRGTLYIYFKGKEDVYMAIAIRGSRRLSQMLTECDNDAKTGIEGLRSLIQTCINFGVKYPGHGEAYLRGYGLQPKLVDAARLTEFNGNLNFHGKKIEDSVIKGINDGTVERDIDPHTTPLLVFSAFQNVIIPSVQLEANMKSHHVKKAWLLEYTVRLLLRGIETRIAPQNEDLNRVFKKEM